MEKSNKCCLFHFGIKKDKAIKKEGKNGEKIARNEI